MNVVVVYFSQSGNTRRVAERMAGVFREAGHDTRTVSLKKASPQDVVAADLLGIGTPCFSGRAPTPVSVQMVCLRMSNGQHHLAALPELGRRVHSVLSLPDRLSSTGFWRKLVVGQSGYSGFV